MRILLVEDSDILRESLARGLREAGHAVDTAGDGKVGLNLAAKTEYQAIILDWMLPQRDGLSVLEELRKLGSRAGVIMLTARDTVADRVRGLATGADDYLVKPFAFEELLARVQAVARRGVGARTSTIKVGPLCIDMRARTACVMRGGTTIDLALTAREFSVLEALALHAGKPVPRLRLEEHVYDQRSQVFSNAIDSTIASIRAKLQAVGAPPLIHTRRKIGYALLEPRT